MSSTAVEQIKEKLSIVEVVGQYVQLHKAGRHFKGKSPFTNEKTPSFFVSPDRGMYYCFSTSQGGDIFTFTQEMEGVDFKGALKILAEKAHVELVAEDPKKRTEREQLYAILEEATKFFESKRSNEKSVQDYLKDRGTTGETVAKWRIGFAPDAWRDLKEYLLARGFSEQLIAKTGLIKGADGGKPSYDVFRNRVMFPIFDSSGRVVAFSGRAMNSDPNTPKYVNSPETELFQKSEIMFGYDKAKQGIRSMDFSLIVEGQFDLVLAHQVGYGNTVAISGTALTPHHVGLLQRLSNRAVLALDADTAGINSIKRGAMLMLGLGMDVKVAYIPEGKDPADLASEDSKLLKESIGSGEHIVKFLLNVIKKQTKDERAYKLRVRDEVLPFLVNMPSRIDREHFEGVVSEALDTTKDAIHFEVERIAQQVEKDGGTPEDISTQEPQKFSRRTDLLIHLLGILLWQKDIDNPSIDTEKLENDLKDILSEDAYDALMSTDVEKKNKSIFEVESLYGGEGEAKRLHVILTDQLQELKIRGIKAKINSAKKSLTAAEQEGDTHEIERLLVECNDLQKKLVS